MQSYVGRYREVDNREFSDRSWGHPGPTSFVYRLGPKREEDVTSPEAMPGDVRRVILMAISEIEKKAAYKWEGIIDNIRIKITKV